MGYAGSKRRKKYVSIKRLENPDTFRQIKEIFEKLGLLGNQSAENSMSACQVANAIKRCGVGAAYVKENPGVHMVVIFLRKRVPVCGTLKFFLGVCHLESLLGRGRESIPTDSPRLSNLC